MKLKDCFVSYFEGMVGHVGNGEAAGHVHSHRAQTSALGVMPPTFRMDPPRLHLSGDTFTDTARDVFL